MNPDTLKQSVPGAVLDTLDGSGLAAALDSLHPIGSPLLGIIIPLFVFVFASVLTWWLYRHFSKQDR
ncbi:MAG: hypothetical protein JXQ83_10590 [Candidatus Glassbacteria bacterium]|nr:hypothetical protein [Candidatus Glassbacteria bacterium]